MLDTLSTSFIIIYLIGYALSIIFLIFVFNSTNDIDIHDPALKSFVERIKNKPVYFTVILIPIISICWFVLLLFYLKRNTT